MRTNYKLKYFINDGKMVIIFKPTQNAEKTTMADETSFQKADKPAVALHVNNKPYDEEMVVGEEEDVDSSYGTPAHKKSSLTMKDYEDSVAINAVLHDMPDYAAIMLGHGREIDVQRMMMSERSEEDEEDGTSEDVVGTTDEEEQIDDHENVLKRQYHPEDFEKLVVSSKIKDLFQYITSYTPHDVTIDYFLKPFIPDYIPAVGDADPMIKVPRPDGKSDMLGVTVLDEPCAKQTDPTVLKLSIKMTSRHSGQMQDVVKSIVEDKKEIERWIGSMATLHKNQPPQVVHYTRNMPSIESLMQEWPSEVEEALEKITLPTADLSCDIDTFTDIACAVLDIPIHKSRVQSLHVLFTLYAEFKNSMHFGSKICAKDSSPLLTSAGDNSNRTQAEECQAEGIAALKDTKFNVSELDKMLSKIRDG